MKTAKELRNRLSGLGLTQFQINVLLEVSRIPRGETLSYKELAGRIGRPKAYRAVGTAVRKNPFSTEIPCHRVIKSDGNLGFYSKGGSDVKAALLREEGAIE